MLVLATIDDLERAGAAASWLNRRRVAEVRLTLPGIDEPEQTAERIRRHHNDCGCRFGELVLGLTVLALCVAPPLTHTARPGWPATILLLVLAAVVGKLAGLAWSRRRLRHHLRRLAVLAGSRDVGGGGDGRKGMP